MRVQREVMGWRAPGLGLVAATGNALGSSPVGFGILAAVATVLFTRHRPVEVGLIAGIALIRLLNTPIKGLLESPRPPTTPSGTNDVAVGLGYPSGHSMGMVLVGGALVIVAFRLSRSTRVRVAVVTSVVAAILATGYGRVVTGAHWPSDVLGAWLMGLGLLGVTVLVVAVLDRWRHRYRDDCRARRRAARLANDEPSTGGSDIA